mmetsp:Transcript_216/g.623  ORF Transcript_216/g.623 Transcript_216/m.623 type:complete len:295 (+) Transcript_216:390-1274(+)
MVGEHPAGLEEGRCEDAEDGAEEQHGVEEEEDAFCRGRIEDVRGQESHEEEAQREVLGPAHAPEPRREGGRERPEGEEGRSVFGLRERPLLQMRGQDETVDDVGQGQRRTVNAMVPGRRRDAFPDKSHHERGQLDRQQRPEARRRTAGHRKKGRGELGVRVPSPSPLDRFGRRRVWVRHRVRRALRRVTVPPRHRRRQRRRPGHQRERKREADQRVSLKASSARGEGRGRREDVAHAEDGVVQPELRPDHGRVHHALRRHVRNEGRRVQRHVHAHGRQRHSPRLTHRKRRPVFE